MQQIMTKPSPSLLEMLIHGHLHRHYQLDTFRISHPKAESLRRVRQISSRQRRWRPQLQGIASCSPFEEIGIGPTRHGRVETTKSWNNMIQHSWKGKGQSWVINQSLAFVGLGRETHFLVMLLWVPQFWASHLEKDLITFVRQDKRMLKKITVVAQLDKAGKLNLNPFSWSKHWKMWLEASKFRDIH